MATNLEQYEGEVFKKLERFKNAKEWSDFLEPLDSLCAVFKLQRNGRIPCIPQLVKRLIQLLNPALPSGIHMKTIECYHAILDHIDHDNLKKDFDALTIGLFSFSIHCRILVAGEYLNLLEKIITKLGPEVELFSKNVTLGVLPFLESENSEFYNRAYSLLTHFINQISAKVFFTSLWRNFIDYPDLRICIINFMNNYKLVIVTDYSLVTNALCAGLKSGNSYIIRSILEISNREFPFIVEYTNDQVKENTQSIEGKPTNESQITIQTTNTAITALNNDMIEGGKGINTEQPNEVIILDAPTNTSPTTSLVIPETQKIKDLVSNLSLDPDVSFSEMSKCNTHLIHHILKIFLMKEVGINKRAYKWLGLGDQILEKDVDVLERGLKTYLNNTEQDLYTFFRIVNSLSDKDNLVGFLIDRFVVDALRNTMGLDKKKDLDCFVNIKRNAKLFLTHSLDDFYRSMYTKLAQLFENSVTNEDPFKNLQEESEDISTCSEFSTVKSNGYVNKKEDCTAEELIQILIYSIEVLEAFNTNASKIHIPLLCHLIVRNKKKVSHELFISFFNVFCEKSEDNQSCEAKEIPSSLINLFYEKNNCTELLDLNLIGSIAKEIGKMDIYNESTRDCITWSNSNLIEQNGVLTWTGLKKEKAVVRNSGGFYNFYDKDILFVQQFINKFGFKDFDVNFIDTLAKYLCFNYKYIEMIRKLSFYIPKDLLGINLWNDFIISKNQKFILFFPEKDFHPVLQVVFPTATVYDICTFLAGALEHGKYIEILLRVATLIDPTSSCFVSLILNLADIIPLVNFMFTKFFTNNEDPYDFQINSAILQVTNILIDNKTFEKAFIDNTKVFIEKFGEISMTEAVSRMVLSIITKEVDTDKKFLSRKTKLQRVSAIINLNGHLFANSTSNNKLVIDEPKKKDTSNFEDSFELDLYPPKRDIVFADHPVLDYEPGLHDTVCLIKKNSIYLISEEIYKLGFNCLYKMNNLKIPLVVANINSVKNVIIQNKNDFYVLKRSIFLVENDFEFIFKNYMHFYRLIMVEIGTMPIKNSFFTFLAEPNTKCSVEVLLEAIPYLTTIYALKMNDLYYKAQELMTEEVRKCSIMYKQKETYYKKVNLSYDSSPVALVTSDYKITYTEEEFSEMLSIEESKLPPLAIIAADKLESVIELAEVLYKKNPTMFISTICHKRESVFLFSILPFKLDIFKKLLISYKQLKFPLKTIRLFLKNIAYETRTALIKENAESLRSALLNVDYNVELHLFIIELFRKQPISDLSKLVFFNLCEVYESRVDQVLKLSINFDNEILILKKFAKIFFNDTAVIHSFKNCCYGLLNSKTYREQALDIIFCYMKKKPNCKIFIDQFVIYFSRNFFSFGLLTKRSILKLISNSSFFDPFAAIENAFSGMDSSFFMSAQSEELLKIQSIKKMSFLVLAQPKNKYSTMADNFVCLINSLVNATSSIKYEVIRLCSVLMFKIDNNYLLTLYPILVADFLRIVHFKDMRVLGEVFKFIDLSIWLNSTVFDFKALFSEDHTFKELLQTKLFTVKYQDIIVDYNTKKLPSFVSYTIGKFSDWSHFSYFLNRMPEYYRTKENLMIESDVEAVEANLTLSFLDSN